ncbi:hypothetical protein BD779DRAFT_1485553 [Infundibulicybe gibba]|nr:hypothetical protein BD779DRAFT_1485553 [Infundibulicybe gibba]
MPRRPRPISRLPPKQGRNLAARSFSYSRVSQAPSVKAPKDPPVESDQSEEDSDVGDISQSEDTSASDAGTSIAFEIPDDGEDVDAPRVARWVDEDELEDDNSEDEKDNAISSPSNLNSLQYDLSSLPLGARRKAQEVVSDGGSDNSDGQEDDSESNSEPDDTKATTKPEWDLRRRTGKPRSSKHAPMEMSSKRPVTRRRTVVEVKAPQPRDPRFLPVTGEFSAQKFQQQYGFLAEAHKNELQTLRESLKRARKSLASSPRDLREERAQEVYRLEQAVKRAESLVNKDRRDRIEQEALGKISKEEKEKRKQGKAGWWMKEADKRALLTRARYDALAAEGGKRAVKKVIDKKQKKIGQKEKRSRPFLAGEGDRNQKRTFSGGEGGGNAKRRRVG